MIPRDHDRELEQVMTVVEVAAALRVSRATVYRLVRAGELPGMRVGKSVRVARRVVEEFMHGSARKGPA